MSPQPRPEVTRVSGNLVILCLTVIILALIGVFVWLEVSGRSTQVWLPVMVGMLAVTVPTVANMLKTSEVAHDVQEVMSHTNGGTEQLVTTIQRQAVLLAQSQPAEQIGPTPQPPPRPSELPPHPGTAG